MWRNCEGTDHHGKKGKKAEVAIAGSISSYCVSAQEKEAGNTCAQQIFAFLDSPGFQPSEHVTHSGQVFLPQ